MTVSQIGQLDRLARRIDLARLAVSGLGDPAHESIEELADDIREDLRAIADGANS